MTAVYERVAAILHPLMPEETCDLPPTAFQTIVDMLVAAPTWDAVASVLRVAILPVKLPPTALDVIVGMVVSETGVEAACEVIVLRFAEAS